MRGSIGPIPTSAPAGAICSSPNWANASADSHTSATRTPPDSLLAAVCITPGWPSPSGWCAGILEDIWSYASVPRSSISMITSTPASVPLPGSRLWTGRTRGSPDGVTPASAIAGWSRSWAKRPRISGDSQTSATTSVSPSMPATCSMRPSGSSSSPWIPINSLTLSYCSVVIPGTSKSIKTGTNYLLGGGCESRLLRTRRQCGLQDLNVGVVADDEAVGLGQRRAALDLHVLADQARLDPVLEVADRRSREHDRVLQLGAGDLHVLAERRVGTDVGVRDPAAAADDRRTAHGRALEPGALLDHHAALDARVHELTLHPLRQVVEDQAVRLEHVLHLTGVLPPAVDDVGIDAQAPVHQRLDRVRDLELVPPGGLDRAGGVEDRRGEHVDPDQRQVGLRLLGLLDQLRDAAVVELGDAVVLGIRHRRQEDQGVGGLGAECVDQLVDSVAEQVVAEVHDERRVAEEALGREDCMGQAGGLVLLDIGDLESEGGAVA